MGGRYRIESELSHGGMGVVYKARERSTGRPVALKRLLAVHAKDSRAAELFAREYKVLVVLQHPRILKAYDYGVDDEGPYFAMELLDGKDLGELAPLPFRAACRHLRDVASSLALMHARRLVYRDLSPRNVRLTENGRAKLIDFGAVVPFGVAEHVVGTPAAIPPEALKGEPLDATTDLYAFGALLYAALTGRMPYAVRSLDDLPAVYESDLPEPPSAHAPDVPPDLDDLVLSLLSRDRLLRPSSAAVVIERLNSVAGLESDSHAAVAQAYLVNPELIGRTSELGQLRRIVSRAVKGRSGLGIVEGEAGTGRTRLLDEIALDAQLRGAIVLRASGEIDRGPFGVVRRLGQELLQAVPDLAMESVREHGQVLSSLFVELSADGKLYEPPRGENLGEHHARLQSALVDWFLSASARRPFALLIDDAHAADDSSVAVVGMLNRDAKNHRLAIILSRRWSTEACSPSFSSVESSAKRIRVTSLSAEATRELSEAVFGVVDHCGQLGQRLFEHTDGNPLQCVDLMRQLIAEGTVTYENGQWKLPVKLPEASFPAGMHQICSRRVSTLSPSARALAAAMSVESGIVGAPECAALTQRRVEDVMPLLEELVLNGILLTAGDDYCFSHNTLRAFSYESLTAGERQRFHERAGRFLLSLPERNALTAFDAGWHLMRGDDPSRGAELLARASITLFRTREGLRHAAPALEAALEVFDRDGRSDHSKFALLHGLILAGWYVDRRYVERYGDRALATAFRLGGLDLANRLAPRIGARSALAIGLAWAAADHLRNKRHILVDERQQPNLITTLGRLVGIFATDAGVSATCGDVPRLQQSLRTGALMPSFGANHVMVVMYDYVRFYTYATQGRFAEAEPIGLRVRDWLGTSEAARALNGEEVARQLQAGILAGLGMFAVVYTGNATLDRAQELESLGYKVLDPAFPRYAYHATRGEVQEARRYLESIEQRAIELGSTWHSALNLPLVFGATAAMSGDIVMLQRAADEFRRLSGEVASLAASERFLRAAIHLHRGEPDLAEQLLAPDIARLTPYSHLQWLLLLGVYARALIALGRCEDSRDLCKRFLQAVPRAELTSLGVAYLQIALALADAETGNIDEARALLQDVLAIHEKEGGPLILSLIHDASARVALMARDEPRYLEHEREMERLARKVQNPTMLAQWQRLTHHAKRVLRASVAPPPVRPVGKLGNAVSILGPAISFSDPQAALHFVIERTRAASGALYTGCPPEARLLAQMPSTWEPPSPHDERMTRATEEARACLDYLTAVQTVMGAASSPDRSADANANHVRFHSLVIPHGDGWDVVGVLALRHEGTPPLVDFDVLEPLAHVVRAAAKT